MARTRKDIHQKNLTAAEGKVQSINQILQERMNPERLARAQKRADLILQRMTLDQLRKDRKVTQGKVATAMQVDQSEISRLERRGDVKLGTLREYVSALGGHVEVRAVFPDKNIELAIAGE